MNYDLELEYKRVEGVCEDIEGYTELLVDAFDLMDNVEKEVQSVSDTEDINLGRKLSDIESMLFELGHDVELSNKADLEAISLSDVKNKTKKVIDYILQKLKDLYNYIMSFFKASSKEVEKKVEEVEKKVEAEPDVDLNKNELKKMSILFYLNEADNGNLVKNIDKDFREWLESILIDGKTSNIQKIFQKVGKVNGFKFDKVDLSFDSRTPISISRTSIICLLANQGQFYRISRAYELKDVFDKIYASTNDRYKGHHKELVKQLSEGVKTLEKEAPRHIDRVTKLIEEVKKDLDSSIPSDHIKIGNSTWHNKGKTININRIANELNKVAVGISRTSITFNKTALDVITSINANLKG